MLEQQRGEKLRGGPVALLFGDAIGRCTAKHYSGPGARGYIAQQVLAPVRRRLQQRVGGDALVVHDVAHPPRAALPRMRMIDRGLVFDQSLRAALQLARLHLDGRSDLRRRRLQQQSGDVLPPAGVARAAEPVRVERVAVDHPRLLVLLQAEGHVGADQIGLAPDQRVHVGIDGIGERRDEHARAGGAHLVLVDEHLRVPLVVHGAGQVLGLDLREHEPVAVVVVADVVVIQPRQPPPLVLRAEVLAVVVGDHRLAVGIERRDE